MIRPLRDDMSERGKALWDELEAARVAERAADDPAHPRCWCGDEYLLVTGGHDWTCAYGGLNVLHGWTDGAYDPAWRTKLEDGDR